LAKSKKSSLNEFNAMPGFLKETGHFFWKNPPTGQGGKRFHRVFIPLRRRENEPFPVFFFSVPWASPITGPLTRILPQGNRCGQIKR
jgi:hypothetical protein